MSDRVDYGGAVLVTAAGSLHLQPKELALLVALARDAGAIRNRDEIGRALWGPPGCWPADWPNNLQNVTCRVRAKLRHGRAAAEIETVLKRGMRLTAPLEIVNEGAQPERRSS